MKNYHNSVILRPKLPQIRIYLKIRKFADSPLREKTDDFIRLSTRFVWSYCAGLFT